MGDPFYARGGFTEEAMRLYAEKDREKARKKEEKKREKEAQKELKKEGKIGK